MGVYAISFRLHEDPTRSSRYDSLVEQIGKCATVWDETTSFALVETSESLSELEHRLYYKSTIIASKDLLLVLRLSDDPAILRGEDRIPSTLRRLRPRVTALN